MNFIGYHELIASHDAWFKEWNRCWNNSDFAGCNIASEHMERIEESLKAGGA